MSAKSYGICQEIRLRTVLSSEQVELEDRKQEQESRVLRRTALNHRHHEAKETRAEFGRDGGPNVRLQLLHEVCIPEKQRVGELEQRNVVGERDGALLLQRVREVRCGREVEEGLRERSLEHRLVRAVEHYLHV